MSATWGPKSSRFTLSHGDLRASGTSVSTPEGVKATVGANEGCWYWEISLISRQGRFCIGTQLDNWAANDPNTLGAFDEHGITFNGQTIAAPVAGDLIGLAMTLTDGRFRLWVAINGAWTFGLAPGENHDAPFDAYTYARHVPYLGLWPGGAIIATANFGATNFAYPKPVGFSQFDVPSSGWTSRDILQDWVLWSANPTEYGISGQYGIEIVEQSECRLSDQWAMESCEVLSPKWHQQWDKLQPDFMTRVMPQFWALEAAFSETHWVPAQLSEAWAIQRLQAVPYRKSEQWAVHQAIDWTPDLLHQRWWLPRAIDWDTHPLRQHWALKSEAGWVRCNAKQEADPHDAFWKKVGKPEATRVVSAVTYTLTLTGGEDDTTDVNLPMSNYSARLADRGEVTLQATVPHARAYAADIGARPHGTLVISRGLRYDDGRIEVTAIARAPLTGFTPSIGARSSALTLQGKQAPGDGPAAPPKTVILGSPSYRSISGGKQRFRVALDHTLRPNDLAIIDRHTILVGEVQHTVSVNYASMEIVEK